VGSTTVPEPMTACFPSRKIPQGISCKTNLRSPKITVWPALWPPANRAEISNEPAR
jgi:hypothetical protein